MKSEYKPLKDLDATTKNYKVKVKVIHKTPPKQSPTKATRYQHLILKDSEGSSMRATLFNNDIERYADAIQRKGEYEITDANIGHTPAEYIPRGGEYQMTINTRAKIKPINIDPTILGPQYQSIDTIPDEINDDEDLIDVIGVVLAVSDIRKINERDIRDVQITDHIYDRPLNISIWNELARVDGNLLKTWSASNQIIGFTALRPTAIRGFSSTSTMSNEIVKDPEGPRPDALRTWAARNQRLLNECRTKLLQLTAPSTTRTTTTVKEIAERKPSTTWQEEVFWLHITMPSATKKDMHVYLGCSKCGRRSGHSENATYPCTNCKTEATSIPRITFKVNITDGTGEIEVTLFSKEVEQLTGITCAEIWDLKQKDDQEPMEATMQLFRDKPVYIQIAPALSLTTSRILNWVVREIAFE